MTHHPGQRVSLAQQMRMTARTLAQVRGGKSLNDAWPADLKPELRPGVQALSFLALRHAGWSQAMAGLLLQKPLKEEVSALLQVALTLLHCDAQKQASSSEHTVVNQAVSACRLHRSTEWAASLVNACLRRFLRERDVLHAQLQDNVQAMYNLPAWWVDQVQHDHPQHAAQVLKASHQAAPMVLRVNRRSCDLMTYGQRLRDAGLEDAQRVGDEGWVLNQPVAVEKLPGWHEGWVSVQDASAQMAASLLMNLPSAPHPTVKLPTWRNQPADGQVFRLLDACAAPGGKSAHWLEQWNVQDAVELVSMDVDAHRLKRVDDTLMRLGLKSKQTQTVCASAADPLTWPQTLQALTFDAILLDAPCTASGIVRRHPDIAWLRRESDIQQLASIQFNLLRTLWPKLKPGGRLVYATCSVFKAEGSEQVARFCHEHHDALWCADSPGHILPGLGPHASRIGDNVPMAYDGFFYAVLDKASHS